MRRWIAVIIVIAAFFRLFNLSNPPLFFDESIHAAILKSLFSGTYKYDPAYHGPLLYYLLYIPVSLLGENEFSLRILPAVTGIAVATIPILYTRYIGRDAAIFSSLLVAISPIIVNYSRFCRADIFQLLLTALFTYFIFRYLESNKNIKEFKFDRDSLYLLSAFIFLALFATLKETFYPFAAIFLLFFIFDIKKFRISDLTISTVVFFMIYAALYTNFFTYTQPIMNLSEFPAVKAVSYWKYQHDIARIAGPWYYYLELILLYDFPAFILAIFAVIVLVKNKERNEFESFIAFWFLASLTFFSYMQEKVPWLLVHVLFPMYVLAGRTLEIINKKRLKAILAIFCIIFSTYGSIATNIVNPTNPAEPALYLPTQYDVREFAEKTRNETIYVFTNVGEYWPLAWYLKNHTAYFFTTGVEGRTFKLGAYIVVNQSNDYRLDKTGLEKEGVMVVRCWTFWTHPDPLRLLEFLILRRPLTDVSCMNFSIYFVKE